MYMYISIIISITHELFSAQVNLDNPDTNKLAIEINDNKLLRKLILMIAFCFSKYEMSA